MEQKRCIDVQNLPCLKSISDAFLRHKHPYITLFPNQVSRAHETLHSDLRYETLLLDSQKKKIQN